MSFWKQTLLAAVLLATAVAVWLLAVPGAAPILARLGLTGAEGAAPSPDGSGGAGRFGGSGGPVVVIGSEVRAADTDDRVSAIGDGRAVHTIAVTPRAPGRIVSLEVVSGDRVEAGEVIALLDREAEEIARARAELAIEDAAATLDRVERLLDTGAATDVRLREARLAVETARLELRDAELALSQRAVTAPIDGTIGILAVEPGARVTTETEIATAVDSSRILVDFRVPERFASRLDPGQPVSITPLAHPEMALEGDVTAVDNRVDPESRTLRVQATLDNAGDRLRGGMAFHIELAFAGESYPSVDPLAIQWGAEGAYVWVAREGRAAQVPVRIIQRNSDSVLVAGALQPGERVVSEGVQSVREGGEIRFEGDPEPAAALGLSRAANEASDT